MSESKCRNSGCTPGYTYCSGHEPPQPCTVRTLAWSSLRVSEQRPSDKKACRPLPISRLVYLFIHFGALNLSDDASACHIFILSQLKRRDKAVLPLQTPKQPSRRRCCSSHRLQRRSGFAVGTRRKMDASRFLGHSVSTQGLFFPLLNSPATVRLLFPFHNFVLRSNTWSSSRAPHTIAARAFRQRTWFAQHRRDDR